MLWMLGKRGSSSGTKDKIQALAVSTREQENKFLKELDRSKSLISNKQFSAVQSQLSSLESSIAHERAQLAKVEETLLKSQQNVEERENNHQNMKIAKMDEDERVEQLLAKHETLSAESMQLERSLAESMKNLDSLLNEAELTENQKSLLKDLQVALEAGGARLRELISEYESVKTRVETLKQQHLDLEEEYTRLVELQLG